MTEMGRGSTTEIPGCAKNDDRCTLLYKHQNTSLLMSESTLLTFIQSFTLSFQVKMCWGYIGLLKAYLSWLFFWKTTRGFSDGRNKMISSDRIQRSSHQLTHPGGCSSLVRQEVLAVTVWWSHSVTDKPEFIQVITERECSKVSCIWVLSGLQ